MVLPMLPRMIATTLCLLVMVKADTCPEDAPCTPKNDCESYKEDLNMLKALSKGSDDYNNLRDKLKGLICNKKPPKVCCQPSVDPLQSSGPESSPSYVPPVDGRECGIEYKPKSAFVKGGESTDLGEFPWMVLLRNKERDGSIKWHCGGTLLNKWYVLTAAHCGPVDFVRAGEWSVVDTTKFSGPPLCHYWDDNTKAQCEAHRSCKAFRSCNKGPKPDKDCQQKEGGQTTCAPPHQDIPVARSIPHPQYSRTESGLAINDIMLLKLMRPVVYNVSAFPVCLPDPTLTDQFGEADHSSLIGTSEPGKAVVVGWGKTDTDVDDSITIVETAAQQKLDLPALSNEVCAELYEDIGGKGADKSALSDNAGGEGQVSIAGPLPRPQLNEHLCAGGEIGKDSCKGDSGGPLLARQSAVHPFMVVGVVSGGTNRCGIGAPGLFTRVSNYRDWIVENMV